MSRLAEAAHDRDITKLIEVIGALEKWVLWLAVRVRFDCEIVLPRETRGGDKCGGVFKREAVSQMGNPGVSVVLSGLLWFFGGG